MQQAIATGLKNNFAVLIAKNDAEIARNNNSLGNAGFLHAEYHLAVGHPVQPGGGIDTHDP